MKTINIQNCTDFRDRTLSVIVNGKKHSLRHQFLTVLADDDKPFKIRVKYLWDGSPIYTFEPKENMALRVSKNRKTINISLVCFIAGLVLALLFGYLYENSRFISFVPIIAPLFAAIYQTIRNRKFFVIKEIKELTEKGIKT